MSEPATPTRAAGPRAFGAVILTWLAGRQRGRWATVRGRWIQTGLTMALIITGLTTWAVALIQPWTGKGGDWGIATVMAGLNTDKVRTASTELEMILGDFAAPTPKAPSRNPFGPARAGVRTVEPSPSEPAAAARPAGKAAEKTLEPLQAAADGAPRARASETSPARLLETIKGMKLKVTLITPTGERWAVINGGNYREGDAIAGLEIIEIQEGKVKLQQGGMTCLLRMD